MDKEIQKRLDAVLEDEIRRSFRIRDVPVKVQAQLIANGLPKIERVRFTRPNSRKRSKIQETAMRQYNRDLKDADVPSHEQIMQAASERGQWSPDKEKRMNELDDIVRRAQEQLYIDGLAEDDWTTRLLENAKGFRAAVDASDADAEKKERAAAVFTRWLDFTPEHQLLYDAQYAKDQERDVYSADVDQSALYDLAPTAEAAEMITVVADLRQKLVRYHRLGQDRMELTTLQMEYGRLFSGSAESRRNSTEELARVYYCTEVVDANDTPVGPLFPAFDTMWDLPDDVIQYLLVEHTFFLRGYPEEAKEYLEAFGFLDAELAASETTAPSGESAPSVESPAPQSSRDDSPQSEGTPESSTV